MRIADAGAVTPLRRRLGARGLGVRRDVAAPLDCLALARSPLVFVVRLETHEFEQLRDPREFQNSMYNVGTPHQGEAAPAVVRSLLEAHQQPESGRVEELDASEIEDE